MAVSPKNFQDGGLTAIDAAVTALVRANAGVDRAIGLAKRHGLPDWEIISAFERAGLDVPAVLIAVESGAAA